MMDCTLIMIASILIKVESRGLVAYRQEKFSEARHFSSEAREFCRKEAYCPKDLLIVSLSLIKLLIMIVSKVRLGVFILRGSKLLIHW
jgi:hypothetical protein